MAMDGILSRLRAKKSSDGQSKPPYPRGKFFWEGNPVAIGDDPRNMLGPLGALGVAPDMWKHVNAQEDMMRQLAQAQIGVNHPDAAQQAALWPQQNIGQFPTSVPPDRPTTTQTLASRAREMFLKRMGGIRNELRIAPEDYLNCHVYGEMVYVFYCFSGRDGCAKESIDLFPSDQLITQFRMVLST